MRKCKDCGSVINKGEHICNNCGCPIKKRSKKAIIICISLLMVALVVGLGIYQIPLLISENQYEKAVEFENMKDYENALLCYRSVISRDEENYNTATRKIDELTKLISNYTFAADCYKILQKKEYFSDDDISLVKVSVADEKCAFTIDGVGYIVSKEEEISSYKDYVKEEYDSESEKYIIEFTPEFQYNSISTSLYNSLRQDTADVRYEMHLLFLEEIDINVLFDYLS